MALYYCLLMWLGAKKKIGGHAEVRDGHQVSTEGIQMQWKKNTRTTTLIYQEELFLAVKVGSFQLYVKQTQHLDLHLTSLSETEF